MEKIIVNRLMRLINALSLENKLEILSKLSEDLKIDFNSKNSRKENLLDELFGVWTDIKVNLSDDIMNSRTSSDREISFD